MLSKFGETGTVFIDNGRAEVFFELMVIINEAL
jgi:hypothetical protein